MVNDLLKEEKVKIDSIGFEKNQVEVKDEKSLKI